MTEKITEIDNKVISQLVYLNVIDAKVLHKSYILNDNQVSVNDLIVYYTRDPEGITSMKERFRTKDEKSEDGYSYDEYHQWTNFLNSDEVAKYGDWKITNVESDNKKEGSGFVAFTFEPEAGQAVVAFRGSEPIYAPYYRNDWHNNATSVYAEHTRQQLKAKQYMEKYADKYDQITLTGHSLGGNLALYATITAGLDIKEKIVATDTFNAPGFNKEFLDGHKLELNEMTSKIQEFQNKYDFVSSLLHNPTNPIIIDTLYKEKNSLAMANHALAYFMIDGNGMLKRSIPQTKDFTCRFIENFTQGLQRLSKSQLEGFVTTVFAVWEGRISMLDLLMLEDNSNGELSSLVKEIVIIGLIELITMMKEEVVDILHDQQRLYQYLENYFQNKFEQIGEVSAQLKRKVYQEIHNIIRSLGDVLKNLWNTLGSSNDHGDIHVDLVELRNIASRLKAVESKVQRVERRMITFRNLLDFKEQLTPAWLGFSAVDDREVTQCVRYVMNAIESLENCERKLLQKAHNF